MFCPGHGSVVLVPIEGLEVVDNTPLGIEVTWRCPCGSGGTARLGRRAARPSVVDGRDRPGGRRVGVSPGAAVG